MCAENRGRIRAFGLQPVRDDGDAAAELANAGEESGSAWQRRRFSPHHPCVPTLGAVGLMLLGKLDLVLQVADDGLVCVEDDGPRTGGASAAC